MSDATPTTDIAVRQDRAVLAITHDQDRWSEKQVAVLRTIGLDKASPAEFGALLNAAQTYDLNPFVGQIGMFPTWTPQGDKYAVFVSVKGMLALAERTGRFVGIEGPYWTADGKDWEEVWLGDGPPAAAKVTVHYLTKQGIQMQTTSAVSYRDRVRTKKDGTPMALWKTMPGEMLANGALRQALQRALPEALDWKDLTSQNVDLAKEPAHPTRSALVSRVDAVNQYDPEDPMDLDGPAPEAGTARQSTSRTSDYSADLAVAEELAEKPANNQSTDVELATRAQVVRIVILYKELGFSDAQRHADLGERVGVTSSKELSFGQALWLINELEHLVNQRKTPEPTTDDNAFDDVVASVTGGEDQWAL